MVMALVSTVAEAAIAPAMISADICRLCARASISPARAGSRTQRHPERGTTRRPRHSGFDQAAFDQAMAKTAGCCDARCLRILLQTGGGVSEELRMAAVESDLLEAVAHSVEGFDHLEIVVHDFELLAQSLDVAVDGAIVD